MVDGLQAGGTLNREQAVADQRAKADADFKMQLDMMDLQRQVNTQNTYITAISTLEKGKDDVLRAIANNLK
jgi:hypothetical protein